MRRGASTATRERYLGQGSIDVAGMSSESQSPVNRFRRQAVHWLSSSVHATDANISHLNRYFHPSLVRHVLRIHHQAPIILEQCRQRPLDRSLHLTFGACLTFAHQWRSAGSRRALHRGEAFERRARRFTSRGSPDRYSRSISDIKAASDTTSSKSSGWAHR